MTNDEARSPLVLPATSAAPGLARRCVSRIAASWPTELRDLVLLLTSELVTNAVRYGNGGISLVVHQTADRLRVEVQDANPAAPLRSSQSDPAAERGRGLQLVDTLATSWGHTGRDTIGKTVWFELNHNLADGRAGTGGPNGAR